MAKTKEERAAYMKRYRAENLDRLRANRRYYYKQHKEKEKAYQKSYYDEHKGDSAFMEMKRVNTKRYIQNNRDKWNEIQRKHRRRKADAERIGA